jgi:hypothetical protein
MKKLLMLGLIVSAAVLIASASVSMAADSPDVQTDQELSQDLNDNTREAARASDNDATERSVGREADTTRENREIADRRGRQPRRGQTASSVASEQGKSDDNSGKSSDEDADEDEDEDGETEIAN